MSDTLDKNPDCERCRVWDNDGPCPDHGGDYMGLGDNCPVCHKFLALKPNGNLPPHKPAGRQSPFNGSMMDQFRYNKCPGGGKPARPKP